MRMRLLMWFSLRNEEAPEFAGSGAGTSMPPLETAHPSYPIVAYVERKK